MTGNEQSELPRPSAPPVAVFRRRTPRGADGARRIVGGGADRAADPGPDAAAARQRLRQQRAAAVAGAAGRDRHLHGAQRSRLRGPVRPVVDRQPRHAQAAHRDVRAPARCRADAVHPVDREQPDQHPGLRSAGRHQPARLFAADADPRLADAGRAARLPAVAELAADDLRGGADPGHRAGDAHAQPAPAPPDRGRPGRHRRTRLRGRGERARLAHRAAARRQGNADPALPPGQRVAAPALDQGHRGRRVDDADHADAGRLCACRR